MPFVKGQSGNPRGRSKGQKNKSTEATKQLITELLSDEAQKLPSLLDQLSPKDRVDAFARLAAYVLPRPQPDQVLSSLTFQKVQVLPSFLESLNDD